MCCDCIVIIIISQLPCHFCPSPICLLSLVFCLDQRLFGVQTMPGIPVHLDTVLSEASQVLGTTAVHINKNYHF